MSYPSKLHPFLIFRTLALLLALFVSSACGPPERTPRLLIDESVAPDLQSLALATWEKFLTAFSARSDCFGDVSLRAARELDGRAAYASATATVLLRVPATAALLDAALVHEWAHHVEFQCAEHEQMRAPFLRAQGLASDRNWFSGKEWADTPSEQYAEATIVLVLGERTIATAAAVDPAAVDVLADWIAAGD